jgi:hypothetical protein
LGACQVSRRRTPAAVADGPRGVVRAVWCDSVETPDGGLLASVGSGRTCSCFHEESLRIGLLIAVRRQTRADGDTAVRRMDGTEPPRGFVSSRGAVDGGSAVRHRPWREASMARHERIGFDHEAMVRVILPKLVDSGAVAADDARLVVWKRAPSRQNNEAAERKRARAVLLLGMDHLLRHRADKDRDRCSSLPCRVAGLSAALVEIAGYLIEREDRRGILAFTQEIEGFYERPAMLFAMSHWFLELNRDKLKGRTSVGDGVCEVLDRLDALMDALANLRGDLLGRLRSRQFQQATAGRPAERLLTAVYQQLRRTGGLSFKEIAEIKVAASNARPIDPESDEDCDAIEKAIQSVEKRVKSKDVRAWHPYVRKGPGETMSPAHSVP